MQENCQQLRQEKLTPLREQAIKDCVDSGQGDQANCEKINANYGETRMVGGKPMPAMFMDIPECVEAYNAGQN